MTCSAKRFAFCLAVIAALLLTSAASAAPKKGITFSGEMTLKVGGKSKEVSGRETIRIPEILRIETQDDTPGLMASLFDEKGYTQKKSHVIITTSQPFMVTGERVKGVYAIQGEGENMSFESIGGRRPPYNVPSKNGDYYILIANTLKEEREQAKIDAAILLYVKITVENPTENVSDPKAQAKADEVPVTFTGKLTVTSGGKKTKIDGSKNINVPESQLITETTQDDHPSVMAYVFLREGYDKQKPYITVKASTPSTVSGERVNGVFAIRGKGENARLESVGGKKSPYRLPKAAGDYYIGIDYEFEEYEEDEIDAAILQYVKVTVE